MFRGVYELWFGNTAVAFARFSKNYLPKNVRYYLLSIANLAEILGVMRIYANVRMPDSCQQMNVRIHKQKYADKSWQNGRPTKRNENRGWLTFYRVRFLIPAIVNFISPRSMVEAELLLTDYVSYELVWTGFHGITALSADKCIKLFGV